MPGARGNLVGDFFGFAALAVAAAAAASFSAFSLASWSFLALSTARIRSTISYLAGSGGFWREGILVNPLGW